MVCGCCGGTIAQVSGKSGGYYGCLAATKGGCDNNTLVRRTLAEKMILEAIKQRISDPEQIACVLQHVELEIAKLRADLPDTLKLKEAELAAEQRCCRISSTSLAKAAAARRSRRLWWTPNGGSNP